jgi:glutamate dehydrogenase
VETARLIERVTTWLLHEHAGALPQVLVNKYRAGVQRDRRGLSSLVTKAEHAALRERTQAWSRAGVPEALVERVGGLQFLLPAVDIVRVAELGRVTLEEAGQLYFKVGRKFGFRVAARCHPRLARAQGWDRQAVAALRDELFASQREVTLAILQSTPRSGRCCSRARLGRGAARALARSEHLLAELPSHADP